MNKYPQVINYGKREYVGYFSKEKGIIKNAMVLNNNDISDFLDCELLENVSDITIGGVEFSVRELTRDEIILFDYYTKTLKDAKRVTLNKLIVAEARRNNG